MVPHSFVTDWNPESGVLTAVPSGAPATGGPPPGAAGGLGAAGVPGAAGGPGAAGVAGPDGSTGAAGDNPVGFRAVASVAFAADGEVCAVDVPDLPERLTPAIPRAHGAESVGYAWLDNGWLWIPLTGDRADRRRSGLAEVEVRLRSAEVTGLFLRFLDEEPGASGDRGTAEETVR
ncbi:hypothetical protein NX801_29170 [Streptomyces sp. LP05-1]|uniref:Uncharacterized protein n=1 Tax=Streptomyces pyxinae TaxID=2970734 RepID=A0ABT2CQC7_9ACTN|nr:hypothetical protein [Streptomyces sp. LP05-1]MCS0639637.1 hypothetical protein [Streptomyces sp. LP05-1]